MDLCEYYGKETRIKNNSLKLYQKAEEPKISEETFTVNNTE